MGDGCLEVAAHPGRDPRGVRLPLAYGAGHLAQLRERRRRVGPQRSDGHDPAQAQVQWPAEGAGENAPAPSAHPSRAPSVAAASQHSRAPSVVNEAGVIAIPSRAPSRATITDAAPRTLTRRGKASKASRLGRATPAPVDIGDSDNIEISIVQPTPTE